MEEKKKPAHEIPLGGVKAAIWANQTNGVTYSCKYKSGDQWKDCTSYGPVEMALISTAFTLANLWISMQGRQTKPSPTIE
jgi:hypothetical protein